MTLVLSISITSSENLAIAFPNKAICVPNAMRSLDPVKNVITPPTGTTELCISLIIFPAFAAAVIAFSLIAPLADTVSENDTIAVPNAVS